ncbi:hypothetical protein CDAR_196491 [Caerostris darwini]|uniref:Uncharacterized protein n=1 Tax=Caerostris darwini TaxID=1538125 RepID=A0AAV4PZ14_9ARAC|nr:hypothetical protein CDAR_196491 [Caerostris darwini]
MFVTFIVIDSRKLNITSEWEKRKEKKDGGNEPLLKHTPPPLICCSSWDGRMCQESGLCQLRFWFCRFRGVCKFAFVSVGAMFRVRQTLLWSSEETEAGVPSTGDDADGGESDMLCYQTYVWQTNCK